MIRKILHMVVAALILVSTTGFTINMHFCHGELIDLALFSPAHSCCGTDTKGPCDTDHSIGKMSHCQDASLVVESTGDFVGSTSSFNLEDTPSIDLLYAALLIANIQGVSQDISLEPPWHKEPPPYREVVLSQIQSYLI